MTRNILDHNGVVIGVMSEPAGVTWTEYEWTKHLSVFSTAPIRQSKPDVSSRQIRLALIRKGLNLETINTAIDAMPEPQKTLARVEWEYASVFERSNVLVGTVALLLGWSDSELDSLWDDALGL